MIITSDDYVAYLNRAAAVIRDSKDYISGLDAATGDGDHWANRPWRHSGLHWMQGKMTGRYLSVSKMQQKTGQRVRGRWKPEKAGPAICFQKDRGIWIRGRSPCPTSSVVFVTI